MTLFASLATMPLRAQVKYDYNEFKDVTEIELISSKVNRSDLPRHRGRMPAWGLRNQRPILRIHTFFGGRKTKDPRISVGFLMGASCGSPYYIADGSRIGLVPENRRNLGSLIDERLSFGMYGGEFNSRTLNLSELNSMAGASSIRYQVCGRVFDFTETDMQDLRSFADMLNSLIE